jgi:hypothetical protein
MKKILNLVAVMLGIATPPAPQRNGRWRFS